MKQIQMFKNNSKQGLTKDATIAYYHRILQTKNQIVTSRNEHINFRSHIIHHKLRTE